MKRVILTPNPYRDKNFNTVRAAYEILKDSGVEAKICLPFEVDKTYLVLVSGFSADKLEKLKEPVTLDGYTIKKPVVRLLSSQGDKARVLVTIHEGRNRQVRRMCALSGMAVQRLARIREGTLELGALPEGKWRYLTADELNALRDHLKWE